MYSNPKIKPRTCGMIANDIEIHQRLNGIEVIITAHHCTAFNKKCNTYRIASYKRLKHEKCKLIPTRKLMVDLTI